MDPRSRRTAPLLLALALLVGCAGTPTRGPEDPARFAPALGPLPYAVAAADSLEDPFSQVFVYTTIAEAYTEVGLNEEAVRVLDRALEQSALLPAQAGQTEVLVEIAAGYFRAGRIDEGLPLLERALGEALAIEDDFSRGLVIQGIIDASFVGGEDAFPVLRDAILSVYVLQDLWTRVSILVDVARQYQESGIGRGVSNLLQQALPAATGLENPWQKAAAFSDIAARYHRAEEEQQAVQQARRAVREIDSVTVITRTEEDARHLLTVAENLSLLGLFDEAVAVVQTIEFPYLRAEGLAAVGRRRLSVGLTNSGLLLLAAATNQLSRERSEYRRADTYAAIAQTYLEAGNRQLALVNATTAFEMAGRMDDVYERSEVLTKVARIYIGIGDAATAVAVMGGIEDGYIRASNLSLIAGDLRESPGQETVVTGLYEAGLRSADQAEYLQDGLYASLAEGFAAVGAFQRALDAVERIEDGFSLSLALAGIGRHLAPGTETQIMESMAELLRNRRPDIFAS